MKVFVFGSNEGGIHGAGAAKFAVQHKGAQMGKCYGHVGNSFAIPTKNEFFEVLSLETIRDYVRGFVAYSRGKRKVKFQVFAFQSVTAVCAAALSTCCLANQAQASGPNTSGVHTEIQQVDFSVFTPTDDPIRHKLDYAIWDYALSNMVLPMGPSRRTGAPWPGSITGTRTRQGHNSRYRLEGSLVGFVFMRSEVISRLRIH